MLTLFCLIGVVALVTVHEYLGAARGTGRGRLNTLRRALLLGAVVSAVAFGARAQLATRAQAALDAWSVEPVAFEISGDTFLRGALEGQQPDRPFPGQGSADDVRAWQAHVVDTLRGRSGSPAEIPASVAVQTLDTDVNDGIRRTLVAFTSWDGSSIPAYVHQPDIGENLPAVLVVPGHGAGIRATSGISVTDYQHALARELARRGYVTLTPELRGFGLLAPNGVPAHGVVAHAALESGSFYKSVVGRDLQVALSVLQYWEGVDSARLAVAGTSLGAELAVFLGVVDPRPRVVVSHSYGGATGATYVPETAGDTTRQPPHGCHTIPGINRILHREDWFRLLAPRAVQIVRGERNVSDRARTFPMVGAEAHRRLGAGERFEFLVEPGGHEFFLEPAVRFLDKWL